MASGNYDHPSYLTRQQIVLGPTTAGANGTSCHIASISALRLRNAVGCIAVAGTIGTNVSSIIFSGTTALGTITYGTGGNTIAALGSSGDMNATVAAGSVISIKNGADATATTRVCLEAYLDPATTWTGTNN